MIVKGNIENQGDHNNWMLLRFNIALAIIVIVILFIIVNQKKAEKPFDFNIVREKAKRLAQESYKKPKISIPEELLELDYEDYIQIQYRRQKSFWKGFPFQLQFFHLGYIYDFPVSIHQVLKGHITEFHYSKNLFIFGRYKELAKELPADLGFSGFRVHYPINSDDFLSEFAVFQGSTYYRVIGANQVYGLSARGIAIDTAMDKTEDFPYYKEFWVKKPDVTSNHITIYALMDGESAVGAYQFVLHPGKTTKMDVKAEFILRRKVNRLGIASLTSMFWFGENTKEPEGMFYPEIHDSDGLLIHNGNDEWIWKPLQNPQYATAINTFSDSNPKGFGLLQRDREFKHYESSRFRYEDRPTAWISISENWGKGEIYLIQIPTDNDSVDNIVAFWAPKIIPKTGKPVNIQYTIYWTKDRIVPKKFFYVDATGVDYKPQAETKTFIVDFKGGLLEKGSKPPSVFIHTSSDGTVLSKEIKKIDKDNKLRVRFRVRTKDLKEPTELFCYLTSGQKRISETWTYTWYK